MKWANLFLLITLVAGAAGSDRNLRNDATRALERGVTFFRTKVRWKALIINVYSPRIQNFLPFILIFVEALF